MHVREILHEKLWQANSHDALSSVAPTAVARLHSMLPQYRTVSTGWSSERTLALGYTSEECGSSKCILVTKRHGYVFYSVSRHSKVVVEYPASEHLSGFTWRRFGVCEREHSRGLKFLCRSFAVSQQYFFIWVPVLSVALEEVGESWRLILGSFLRWSWYLQRFGAHFPPILPFLFFDCPSQKSSTSQPNAQH